MELVDGENIYLICVLRDSSHSYIKLGKQVTTKWKSKCAIAIPASII